MINEINGSDVNIASQGVGGLFVLLSIVVLSVVVVVVSTADSIKDRSSGEIFLYSDGELLPKINQNTAQISPAAPEK